MNCGGLKTRGVIKKSTSENPLLTIITVVYNGEKNIEQTIQSVLTQTYKNIEYIIIDGNSNDGTVEIIKKYENEIDYWISEPDRGIYDAMNKGVSLATGDYISLLNADDFYDRNACEIVVSKIAEEKADIYCAIERFLNENDKVVTVYGNTSENLGCSCLAHETCFISNSLYKNYKYDLKYKSAADFDFLCKLKTEGASFCFIDKVIMSFRLGGMSSTKRGLIEENEIKYKYGFITYKKYILKKIYIKLVSILNGV